LGEELPSPSDSSSPDAEKRDECLYDCASDNDDSNDVTIDPALEMGGREIEMTGERREATETCGEVGELRAMVDEASFDPATDFRPFFL